MAKNIKRHSDTFRRHAARFVTHQQGEEIFIGDNDKAKEICTVFRQRYVNQLAPQLLDAVLGPATAEINKCTTIKEVQEFSTLIFPEENRQKMLDFLCDFGDEYRLNEVQLMFLLNTAESSYLHNVKAGISAVGNARIRVLNTAPSLFDAHGRSL